MNKSYDAHLATFSKTLILSNAANTYSGFTLCNLFSLVQVTKISNGGIASSIGTSSNAASNLDIWYGATLKYVGIGDSTDRLFSLQGNTGNIESLDSSGSGALIFTNTGNYAIGSSGTQTIMNLTGTNTGNNTLAGKITDYNSGNTTTVKKSGTGTWILSGNNTYTGNTTITAGTLQIGSGGTTGALSTSSAITNNATLVFNRSNAIVQGTDFANVIAGTGSVTLAGTGTLTLNGTNTFSGNTTIASGTLSTNNTNASANAAQGLGQGTVLDLGVAGTSSGKLLYTGAAGTFAKSINVLGNGSDTIQNSGSGLLTLSGNITKNGTKLTLQGGSNGITVTGAIAGSSAGSDLIIDGGITTLASVNTYNGPTFIINAATLNADVINALPTSNGRIAVIIDQTGGGSSTLVLGADQAIASLSGAPISTVNLNSHNLTIGTASGSTTFAGAINGTGGTLTKDSASIQILTGVNGYTGATLVSAGTLIIDGSTNISSAVSVNGGTLGGHGTINGSVTVNSGGTLNPGVASQGTLTIGSLALQTGSTSVFSISGSPGAITFDAVNVANGGAVQFGGTLTLNFATTIANSDSLTFFNFNTTHTSDFDFVTAAGSYSGSFVLSGQIWSLNTGTQILSFNESDGRLTAIAAPEPQTWALLAFSLTAIIVCRRGFHRRSTRNGP